MKKILKIIALVVAVIVILTLIYCHFYVTKQRKIRDDFMKEPYSYDYYEVIYDAILEYSVISGTEFMIPDKETYIKNCMERNIEIHPTDEILEIIAKRSRKNSLKIK